MTLNAVEAYGPEKAKVYRWETKQEWLYFSYEQESLNTDDAFYHSALINGRLRYLLEKKLSQPPWLTGDPIYSKYSPIDELAVIVNAKFLEWSGTVKIIDYDLDWNDETSFDLLNKKILEFVNKVIERRKNQTIFSFPEKDTLYDGDKAIAEVSYGGTLISFY